MVERDPTETATGSLPPVPDERGSVETYETKSGVVFYDAANPLAWIESSRTLRLDEAD